MWKSKILTPLVAVLLLLLFQPAANADPHIEYNATSVEFINGNQIKVSGYFYNNGNRDATVTGFDITSFVIHNGNGRTLWDGTARFTNMRVFVPVDRTINHTLYINNVAVPYYDGYLHWNMRYVSHWNAH